MKKSFSKRRRAEVPSSEDRRDSSGARTSILQWLRSSGAMAQEQPDAKTEDKPLAQPLPKEPKHRVESVVALAAKIKRAGAHKH